MVGYVGAFLTALYTFRMIFRAFHGEPVPGGQGARRRPPRATPRFTDNPANGEIEDTDVGFPGPHHAIAERALPMRIAMGCWRSARSAPG